MTTKLVVEDADAMIEFLGEVFGADVEARYTMGDTVVFAEVILPNGTAVQVKDADGHDPGPNPQGSGVILDVEVDDPDALMARALDHGAQQLIPVADQPYGARQGRFRDPMGHQWIVGTPQAMDPADVQAALDGMA